MSHESARKTGGLRGPSPARLFWRELRLVAALVWILFFLSLGMAR